MPAYFLPGTETGPRRARVLGLCALAVTLLVAVVWRLTPDRVPADEMHVVLLVGQVGEGVGPGTDVHLDGVKVGSVRAIELVGQARERIDLSLNKSQLFGLTNTLSLDYVPGNLFGISAVELHPNSGGRALMNNSTVDMTVGDSGRVQDATLAALLKGTGQLTADVLTPKLAGLLSTASHDLSAFTPLLQAIGSTARNFAETQQIPPSLLFDRFGATLTGLPPMLTGGLAVLQASYTNSYLQTPEHLARFSKMWTNVQYQLLPAATQTLDIARTNFAGLMPIATVILDRMAGSVSTPDRSTRQLSELLARLDNGLHDTPDGPVSTPGPSSSWFSGLTDRWRYWDSSPQRTEHDECSKAVAARGDCRSDHVGRTRRRLPPGRTTRQRSHEYLYRDVHRRQRPAPRR